MVCVQVCVVCGVCVVCVVCVVCGVCGGGGGGVGGGYFDTAVDVNAGENSNHPRTCVDLRAPHRASPAELAELDGAKQTVDRPNRATSASLYTCGDGGKWGGANDGV